MVNIFTRTQGVRSPLDSLLADPFFDLFFEGDRRRSPLTGTAPADAPGQ